MAFKRFAATCALALLILAGCGDDDKGTGLQGSLVGTWLVTSATLDGQPYTPPEWIIVLNSDGSGSMEVNGTPQDITWSAQDNQLTINSGGEVATGPYSLTLTTLTWTVSNPAVGVLVLIYTKQ